MKFIIATNNAKKLVELERILNPLGIEAVSAKEAGVVLDDVDETGTTFSENAFLKANAAFEKTGMPAVADDSGICVDALGGRPGIFSARYCPELCVTDEDRTQRILDEMKDVPEGKRSAYFECAIVYVDKYVCESFTGRCEGTIGYEERGENGFGYDPIFLRDGRTLAEMSSEEKNAISHRGAAMEKLVSYLKESYGV